MKKIIFILALITSISTALTSCKKDKKTDKEKAIEFLVKDKWYYQSLMIDKISSQDCFDSNLYLVFKSNGTFIEMPEQKDGKYVVNEDGKTFTLEIGDSTYDGDIVKADVNNPKLTLSMNDYFEFTLAKIAKPCNLR